MDIVVIGLNHKTAPVEVREKVSFPEEGLERPLKEILSLSSVREDMILSTCNRVEVYVAARNVEEGIHEVKRFLSDFHGIPHGELEKFLYVHQGEYEILEDLGELDVRAAAGGHHR